MRDQAGAMRLAARLVSLGKSFRVTCLDDGVILFEAETGDTSKLLKLASILEGQTVSGEIDAS
jgi:hypothetical protein